MSTLSADQKLDLIINEMSKFREVAAEIATLVGRVNVLESKATAQDTTIVSLVAEVKLLKEQANERDQFSKLNALRIFNIPGSDAETGLAACVYDTVGNTITEVFRAGKFSQGANKPPPPIIIKFTTPTIRMAVLQNKRNNMPPPLSGGGQEVHHRRGSYPFDP